ncbi:T9SS type A sorting domain-containing protein [Aquimarina megaterium]|uniref:T9SS type A sorting domain-containing protein n=1 Tax=Aquimarina megaterium TaxID=1443666 RepID=UPI00094502EC|nr:T9SS type A sorting domain-containing protein [Aquimarina megaterium]
MKEKLLTLGLFFIAVNSYSQIINFPDPNFKYDLTHYSTSIDTNNDGEIDVTEAQNYHGNLFIGGGQDISDLTGIEFFVNISGLYMRSNLITELDLSNNLNIRVVQVDDNRISKINLGNNIVLEALYCSFNELVDIDVSKYPVLSLVDCRNNPNLKTLDIANGNNYGSNFFCWANDNPKLTCINIDSGFTPPINHWYWKKDTSASYSDICVQSSTGGLIDLGPLSDEAPESGKKVSNDIIVYPNPANSFVNIRSKEKIKELTLYTFVGEQVLQKQNTPELDISEVNRGVYWLVIETKSKTLRKKVVKE